MQKTQNIYWCIISIISDKASGSSIISDKGSGSPIISDKVSGL